MTTQSEIERASRLLNEGKGAECVAVCAAIVAQDPKNAVATHLLGLALKEMGDWAQAEQWMRLSTELDPNRAEFQSNLANLLRRREKYRQAVKFYRSALSLSPADRSARRGLALTLNDLGRFDDAAIECRLLVEDDPVDAEGWVMLGLTEANREHLPASETAYRRAITLDPNNQIAHHNLGALLSRMEKPEAALVALRSASALGADGFELAFNRARVFLDMNDLVNAEVEFAKAVRLQPLNTDAQLNLARVRFVLGDRLFARSLADACAANRDDIAAQQLLGEVLWRGGKLPAAEAVLRDVLARKGPHPQVQGILSSILLEAGLLVEAEAQAVEAATAAPDDAVVIETLVAVLLSRGCAEDAMPFIRGHRRRLPDSQAWLAYEATAARMLGHDLYHELYDYEHLIRVFDVATPAGWSSMSELNQSLVQALAARHRLNNHPLDQSLRHGTQTVRSLLTEDDSAIKAILSTFTEPIEEYRRIIGANSNHPLSARNRGVAEFTGAWSVRLRREGYHVNHFHPDGWISSAYYVDVPPETHNANAKSGWLKFGEPRYPIPGLTAERFVQPRPGKLVLFPSYMWHGTNAIQGDEQRLSIAFDIKPTQI